ncbi:MAG: hypothetical protein JWP53_922 [Conexibacter sp.]|jgi:hypothetical protein|nr:hypothetical protein [Conexibacter sp.]MDX6730116.1 hypothetical protein [Baekduia sp.]
MTAQAEAWPVTAITADTAGTILVYLDGSSTANDLQVALYADGAGKPGTRLAVGTTSGATPGAWTTIGLSGAVAVTSGTTYWLGVMSGDPNLVVRDRTGGACTAHASYNALGTSPARGGQTTTPATSARRR